MKNKVMVLIGMVILSTGCATSRTRSSDPVMRVAIDGDSMSAGSYMRLQHALMDSGMFIVVDRKIAFKAIAKEQDRQHKTDRFQDTSERYAKYGELYGVGGVIVGVEQCKPKSNWLNYGYFACLESLSLVNATTGEVMAIAEAHENTENEVTAPEWDDAVERLVKHYPKTFIDTDHVHQTVKYSSSLKDYREQISKESRKPASNDAE